MRWVRLDLPGPKTLVLSPRASPPSDDPDERRLARAQRRMCRKFWAYKRAVVECSLEEGLFSARRRFRQN